MRMGSKVFGVEDFVAFFEDLISLSSQIEFFSDVAHVEQLLAVLLEQQWADVEVSDRHSDDKWPPDHLLCDENSPAEQYISNEERIAESFQYDIIVILSRE